MGVGLKSLEKRENAFTRKLIIIGTVIGCLLFLLGASLMVNIALMESSLGALFKILAYITLPLCFFIYILIRYYKKLLINKL